MKENSLIGLFYFLFLCWLILLTAKIYNLEKKSDFSYIFQESEPVSEEIKFKEVTESL